MKNGKFIVLYGINNLGKTTQAEMLVNALKEVSRVTFIKYALYDLKPTGPILNDYLRNGNPWGLTHREFKIFHAMNRTQYDSVLREKLADEDRIVIAEDYVGTSIAWGIGSGIDKDFIEEINSHLLKPDIAILLDGERFTDGIEEGHKHESDNDLTEKVRQVHLKLAKEKGWIVVNANQDKYKVHSDILNAVLARYKNLDLVPGPK